MALSSDLYRACAAMSTSMTAGRQATAPMMGRCLPTRSGSRRHVPLTYVAVGAWLACSPAASRTQGIAELASWLHERNFKFGLYLSAGWTTCSTGAFWGGQRVLVHTRACELACDAPLQPLTGRRAQHHRRARLDRSLPARRRDSGFVGHRLCEGSWPRPCRVNRGVY